MLLCTQVDIIWACANCLLKLWAGLAALAKPTPTGGWRCWINYSIQVCFSTNQGMSLPRRIDSYLWNPMGTVWVKIICQPPKKNWVGSFSVILTLDPPTGTNNHGTMSHRRPSFSSQFSKLLAMNSTAGTKVLWLNGWLPGCGDHALIPESQVEVSLTSHHWLDNSPRTCSIILQTHECLQTARKGQTNSL